MFPDYSMKLIAIFGLLFLAGCNGNGDSELISDKQKDSSLKEVPEIIQSDTSTILAGTENRYTFETYETPGLGWGYKIYEYGNLFINQPHIPAVQGNKGFSTEEHASITAEFAISKMNKGIVPPTLSTNELDSLGVLY